MADGLTATQIERTAERTVDELLREVTSLAPAAVRGRRRTPAPVRRLVRFQVELPVSGSSERWRLGYLVDRVLTRDEWMHRSDIALATGRDLALTPEHDGRFVADIVADWETRHRHDFRLQLSGAAGGVFRRGVQPVELRDDAVPFCRALSGRGGGLPLHTEVPF